MPAQRRLGVPALRYSIRQLILGMALVGLACVALRNAGPVWVAVLLGGVLILLGAAIPLALFREGQQRAFWFGFGLFGWLYLLVLAYSWSLDPNTAAGNPLRPQSLITCHLTTLGYHKLYPAAETGQYTAYGMPGMPGGVNNVNGTIGWPQGGTTVGPDGTSNSFSFYFGSTATSVPRGPTRENFINVAHAFWAIAISVCGGWFSCWVFATRPARPQPEES
jgi:hypothetical protein